MSPVPPILSIPSLSKSNSSSCCLRAVHLKLASDKGETLPEKGKENIKTGKSSSSCKISIRASSKLFRFSMTILLCSAQNGQREEKEILLYKEGAVSVRFWCYKVIIVSVVVRSIWLVRIWKPQWFSVHPVGTGGARDTQLLPNCYCFFDSFHPKSSQC